MFSWLKDFLIPHHKNNHHPHVWRNSSAVVILALIILTEAAVLSPSLVLFKTESWLASILPGVLSTLTNEERQTENLSLLATNSTLEEAARLKAEDMATKGYFSHNTPEGYLPWHWLEKVGYQYILAGENLAVNFSDSKDVVEAWMNSPLHRANIMKQNYSEIGIGMAEGKYQGRSAIFVVQFFGTPALAIEPEPLPKPVAVAQLKPKTASPIVDNKVNVAPVETSEVRVLGSTDDVNDANDVEENPVAESKTSVIDNALASPRHAGAIIFYILFLFILIAYILAIFIKIKIQHPKIIALGLILLAIIAGLIFFNNKILKDSVVVAINVLQ